MPTTKETVREATSIDAVRHKQRVKDVMNPDVMTVTDDMTSEEVVRYLTEREISGAPVVDDQGHLVGVVSMTDIGRHLAEPSDFAAARLSRFYGNSDDEGTLEDLGPRRVEERTVSVRDLMTPAVHAVTVDASVAEAARIMIEQHIHRLVVTQGREPVGILTSMDLLQVIAGET